MADGCFSAAERIFLSLQRRIWKTQHFTARAETEDDRLEKDRLEVLRIDAQTLREALSANVKPRGRGQFQLNS